MLNLLQTEFLKLRRRKLVWLMLSGAIFMPFVALLYFQYVGKTGGNPVLFYKWSALGYTMFIVLPFILGVLCTILMQDEYQHDILNQLWIVPVSKMGYFFSKFFIVLIYSVCFMLITAIASVLFSVLPGIVAFEWESVLFLLKKCLEISVLSAFAILPILAIAASQKGYILPICATLVYTFLSFLLMPVNMYANPISSMAVIIMRNKDIPGLVYTQAINIPLAFLIIFVWDLAAVVFVNISLIRRR